MCQTMGDAAIFGSLSFVLRPGARTIGALMLGDLLAAAQDDNLIDKVLNRHLLEAVTGRRGVVVDTVRQRTSMVDEPRAARFSHPPVWSPRPGFG